MGTTVAILVAGMMASGCLNTLLLKYQDQTCEALDSGGKAGCASLPVLQSLMMFVGESLCFIVIGLVKLRALFVSRQRARDGPLLVAPSDYTAVSTDDGEDDDIEQEPLTATLHKPTAGKELRGLATLYLALPALCDILGTTIGSIGLLFVPASIYQMCRGSLVLYVGLFSVIFLRRRLVLFQWLALLLVTVGVFIVGLSNVVYPPSNKAPKAVAAAADEHVEKSLLGILMITGAQLFTATQFVLEEWILGKYSVEPLKVAGFEGLWGAIMSGLGILVAYYTYGNTVAGANGTFDVGAGLSTILSHTNLWTVFILFALCIASFNFFGLSVTQAVSATSRSTIDTCRTLLIWAISMLLGWEVFKFLQLVGFSVQVYATLVFNGVIRPPRFLATTETIQVEAVREHTLE